MEHRLHPFVGAEPGEPQPAQFPLGLRQPCAQVFLLVAVAAKGQDSAAQLPVQAQDLPRRGQVRQAVTVAGGVDLDALAVGNDGAQN